MFYGMFEQIHVREICKEFLKIRFVARRCRIILSARWNSKVFIRGKTVPAGTQRWLNVETTLHFYVETTLKKGWIWKLNQRWCLNVESTLISQRCMSTLKQSCMSTLKQRWDINVDSTFISNLFSTLFQRNFWQHFFSVSRNNLQSLQRLFSVADHRTQKIPSLVDYTVFAVLFMCHAVLHRCCITAYQISL